jgi:hypothetical protein
MCSPSNAEFAEYFCRWDKLMQELMFKCERMAEMGTEMLTSAVVPMAIVCSKWLRATGRLGAAVAAPNVAQR